MAKHWIPNPALTSSILVTTCQAPVAQLVEALVLGTRCWWFESLQEHFYWVRLTIYVKTQLVQYNYSMKTCSTCKEIKTDSQFSKDSKRKDGLQHRCKSCQSALSSKHYKLNKDKYSRHRTTNRHIRKEFVWQYLKNNPCVDCGEDDPVVLDLDHVNGEKIDSICSMCLKGVSMKILKEEVEKCESRCRNCHVRRHSKEGGFWRYSRSLND